MDTERVRLVGIVISYDEKFGLPYSEIELASGERIFLTLGQNGLAIKLLMHPGREERVLFQANPSTVAKICDGLFDIQPDQKASPLRVLVAAASQLPDVRAVENAFNAAAVA